MSAGENARELAAELELLELYDVRRASQGHDYGCGQRAGELMRRRRELERLDPLGELEPPTREELDAAWHRVLLPRFERVKRDAEKWGESSNSIRAVATFERLARVFGKEER